MSWQQYLKEFLERVVENQMLIWLGVIVFGGKAIYERMKKHGNW